MKPFFLLSVFILVSSCASSDKKAYDSLLDRNNNQIKKKAYAEREIAHLKNLSQFETESFNFITQQMKEVIKNYTNLKNQLIKIEDKLDRLLVKINQENFGEEISNAILLKESEEGEEIEDSEPVSLQEEITDDSIIIPEEEKQSDEKDLENDGETQAPEKNSKSGIQSS